jgi:hypothetical protein
MFLLIFLFFLKTTLFPPGSPVETPLSLSRYQFFLSIPPPSGSILE